MATRLPEAPRVERQRSNTLASCDNAASPASSSSLQQQPIPRVRRRTLGQQDDNNDDLAAERRRSSLISRTEPTPVPAIPRHFLHTRNSSLPPSPRSHAAPGTTTATTATPSTPGTSTTSYNPRNHAYNRDSRGAPASSPLAHDFDFSFTVDTPLRALSQAQAQTSYNSPRRAPACCSCQLQHSTSNSPASQDVITHARRLPPNHHSHWQTQALQGRGDARGLDRARRRHGPHTARGECRFVPAAGRRRQQLRQRAHPHPARTLARDLERQAPAVYFILSAHICGERETARCRPTLLKIQHTHRYKSRQHWLQDSRSCVDNKLHVTPLRPNYTEQRALEA